MSDSIHPFLMLEPRSLSARLLALRSAMGLLAGIPGFALMFTLSTVYPQKLVSFLHGGAIDYTTAIIFILLFVGINILTAHIYFLLLYNVDADKYEYNYQPNKRYLMMTLFFVTIAMSFVYIIMLGGARDFIVPFFFVHSFIIALVTPILIEAFTSYRYVVSSVYSIPFGIILALLFAWILWSMGLQLFFILFFPFLWFSFTFSIALFEFLAGKIYAVNGVNVFYPGSIYEKDA